MVDVLIIGSGPAGLSAAIYAKRANLSVKVLEKFYMGFGQITESSKVDNYLGMPGINGFDLGETFYQHAESFGVEFLEGEAVKIQTKEEHFSVSLASGKELEAKTIIYAAGAMHRHLGVPGEDTFSGRGVSYCAVCDGAFYRDKVVAVAGGGNTALDDALYLSELCSKVYLIHRRSEFRGAGATLSRLREKENVEILAPSVISAILGEGKVSELAFSDGRKISCQGLFIAVGMKPQTEVLNGLISLDETGYVVAEETGKTSVPGFFVAGDVRKKALRPVITAAADGANAAVSAAEYLREK